MLCICSPELAPTMFQLCRHARSRDDGRSSWSTEHFKEAAGLRFDLLFLRRFPWSVMAISMSAMGRGYWCWAFDPWWYPSR